MALGIAVVSTMTRSTLVLLINPGLARRLDRQRQQRLDAGLANALSPTRQARWIHWRLGLQVDLAREELPVRVLHPSADHGLVGGVERVLKVSSPATNRGDSAGRPRPELKCPPNVRWISSQSIKPARRTSGCFMLICSSQPGPEQIRRRRLRGVRTHAPNLVEICRKPQRLTHKPAILTTKNA